MMRPLRAGAVVLLLAVVSGCIVRSPQREPATPAGPPPSRQQVLALLDEARRIGARRDFPMARASARQALAVAQQGSWIDLAADAHFLLGGIFWKEGLLPQAASAFVQAYKASRRAGDRAGGVRSLNALANVLLDLREYDQAFEASAQALQLARRLGDLRAQSTALNNVGEAHRLRGRYGAAMEAYQKALALARHAGTFHDAQVILENMAKTARRQGEMERAAIHYKEALSLARRSGSPERIVTVLNALSSIRLVQERPSDALLLAREASELGRRQNLKRPLASAVQNQGLAAWAMGDRETARSSLDEAVRLATEVDDQQILAYAQWHLSRLMLELGDQAAAVAALGQALELFRALGLSDEARKIEAELRAMKGD